MVSPISATSPEHQIAGEHGAYHAGDDGGDDRPPHERVQEEGFEQLVERSISGLRLRLCYAMLAHSRSVKFGASYRTPPGTPQRLQG